MDAGRTFSLDGKVVMVTGASSGLGERMAEVAAANGAKVALVSRRRDVLNEVKARIEGRGGIAEVFVADVTDAAAMAAAFDGSQAALGPLDVFVANAGIGVRMQPMDITPEVWSRTLGVDLEAVFFGAQEAARRMITAGKGGSIINVASIAGLRVATGLAPYSIAKTGVIQLTKLLASELGTHGIRVNALAPGYVATNMTYDFLASPDGLALRGRLPLQRFGEPEDIDGPFLLLASNAGAMMTGTVVVFDNGQTLM